MIDYAKAADAVEREGGVIEGLVLAADTLIEAGDNDGARVVMDLIHKRRPSMFAVEFPG